MAITKEARPDSDFRYRIVSGYDGHRMTWHSMECATGRNAKYSKRTAYTPESRREAIKAKNIERFGHEGYVSYRDNMAGCCLGKQDRKQSPSPSFTTRQAEKLFREAREAGIAAGNGITPNAMIVGTPTTLLGDDIDYNKRTYYVSEGVCGFAWVVIRPGSSSLARRAVKLGIGYSGYGGGVEISVRDHGQSYERKVRHAIAYADVLRSAGIEASSTSRLD